MKHKISKVFFVIVMLLVLSLLAVACNDSQGNETDSDKYAVTYVGGRDRYCSEWRGVCGGS